VRSVFQLAPELAADLADVEQAVFVDASVDLPPGEISLARIHPRTSAKSPLGHHSTPAELLALTTAAYGRAPRAWLLQIGAASFELGAPLSPVVARAVEHVAACLSPEDGPGESP
jgi:hydrogenase maturation protease